MNTIQRTTKTRVRYTMPSVQCDGKITARDLQDFMLQVNEKYESEMGRRPQYDDSYFAWGDESGLHAEWDLEE